MQDFIIRKAVRQDCKDIIRLIKVAEPEICVRDEVQYDLAVYEKEPESVVETTPEIIERDCFGENPWFYCLVAEKKSQKELVGFALYFRAYSTWKGRMMYLEDIFVKPSERKKGIGIGFIKEITKAAVQMKCYKVKWAVLEWNQNSIDFFESLGAVIEREWKLVCLDNSAMLALASEK